MSNAVMIENGEGVFSLTGTLTFTTIQNVYQQGLDRIGSSSNLRIELSRVEQCDSAGLALMAVWAKAAKQKRCELVFANPPEQLISIAQITGIKALFF